MVFILCQWQDESKKRLHPVMIGFVITTAPLWVVFMHVCTLKCALLFFSCCSACVFVFINTAGYSYRCLQEVVATDSSSSDIYTYIYLYLYTHRWRVGEMERCIWKQKCEKKTEESLKFPD